MRSGATFAVVIGDDEAATGEANSKPCAKRVWNNVN